MSVWVVYRPVSENARITEEFLHDFERRTGRRLDTINPDTRDGGSFCSLYSVVQYPTIVAASVDGRMLNMWQGVPLPTIDEVSFYVQ